RTQEATRLLRERGIGLAIVSGRPPRGMAMLVEPLGIVTPLVAFNGGMFGQPDLPTVLEERTLSRAGARDLVDALLDARLDARLYRGHDWFVRDPSTSRVGHEQDTVKFPPSVIADLDSVLDDVVKIVGTSEDYALVASCEAALRERVAEHASVGRSQPYYLD